MRTGCFRKDDFGRVEIVAIHMTRSDGSRASHSREHADRRHENDAP